MLLNDEVFQNGGSPWEDEGLFNDILFNGQTKSLEISLPNEDNYWNEVKKQINSRKSLHYPIIISPVLNIIHHIHTPVKTTIIAYKTNNQMAVILATAKLSP